MRPALTARVGGAVGGSCRGGDRGRLLGFERVASHPTAADARAYFDSWVEFYQDFYQFPADLPVDIDHGFDTYKVTYCTVDVAPPGKRRPAPTAATGNVSVPRKAGPLDTVAYLHGTSVSFYDAPSNPNVFGELSENGESFDGPPSSAIFAASREVLRSLRVRRSGELFTFGFSQGGHAALALQRALEKRRVEVTATAMVGGVLDIEPFFLSGIANTTTVTVPLYISFSCWPTTTSTTCTGGPRTCSASRTRPPCRACSTCGTSSTTCSRACRRPPGSYSGRRSSGP